MALLSVFLCAIVWCNSHLVMRIIPNTHPVYQVQCGPHLQEGEILRLLPTEKRVWELDLDKLKDAICNSSPWVKGASVYMRRTFPNVLVIKIKKENRFIAIEGDVLIGEDGVKVKMPEGFEVPEIPYIESNGIYSSEELRDFCRLLYEVGIVPEKIIRGAYGDWWGIRIGGFLVELSREDPKMSLKTFVEWCKIVGINPTYSRDKKTECIVRIVMPPRVVVKRIGVGIIPKK